MKIAIITVAGVSSRFNKNIPDDEKVLKCLYYEDNPESSLIHHMLNKIDYADKIVVVGGYKFSDLIDYVNNHVPRYLQDKIILVENNHYDDLSSGYSLYLGIKEALDNFDDVSDILFVEGDLDIDDESFLDIVNCSGNVLTFNPEPIYSNKAVVLCQNEKDEYHYLFNSDHGLLTINEPFKAIFNSGQVWKFQNMELLKVANDYFKENIIEDTNLGIIQKYLDLIEYENVEIIGFKHWVNCNTRKDYEFIKKHWGE